MSFKISGATYPGDPHLKYNFPPLYFVESPKSVILIELSSSLAKIRFSGFRSRWIIPYSWIWTNASRILLIITLKSFSVNSRFIFNFSKSSPPSRYSKTMWILFYDSYTSYWLIMLLWLSFLKILISCWSAI